MKNNVMLNEYVWNRISSLDDTASVTIVIFIYGHICKEI